MTRGATDRGGAREHQGRFEFVLEFDSELFSQLSRDGQAWMLSRLYVPPGWQPHLGILVVDQQDMVPIDEDEV
jgi:hypothetical protein